uniref:Glycosyltransferase family 8 protein n=1 Tax=Ascaris lumbricoides TaxID=6252 RepID=A0A0M3HM06_ASCLU
MLNEGNMVDVVYYNQSFFHAGDIDLENVSDIIYSNYTIYL